MPPHCHVIRFVRQYGKKCKCRLWNRSLIRRTKAGLLTLCIITALYIFYTTGLLSPYPRMWGPEYGMDIIKNRSEILVNASTVCPEDQDIYLLIMYLSAVPNFKQRQFVRKTVGSLKVLRGHVIRHVFLLGVTDNDQEFYPNSSMNQEQEIRNYSDIAKFNILDTYRNLTLKTSAGLHWVTMFCSRVRYVLKTDDDIVVFPERVVEFLEKLTLKQETTLYNGLTRAHGPPTRNTKSKWYVPWGAYKYRDSPDYNLGAGILLSRPVVEWFSENTIRVPWYPSEDVYVGLLARSVGIAPTCNSGVHIDVIPFKPSPYDKDPRLIDLKRHCYYYDIMLALVEPANATETVWNEYNKLRNISPEDCRKEWRPLLGSDCKRYSSTFSNTAIGVIPFR